jgi:hypothetical protein
MKSVVAHAVALLVALPVAYFTWTRDPAEVAKQGAILVWDGKAADVLSAQLDDRAKDVTIETRHDDGDYVWGTRIAHLRNAEDSTSNAQLLTLPDSVAFRVGKTDGESVMNLVAAPIATRDLGVVPDSLAKEFGFAKDSAFLRVVFPKETREMLIGGAVYGSEDHYVMRLSDRNVFVLPGAALNLLRGGDVMLTDRQLHTYKPDEVKGVKITTPKSTKSWVAVGQLGSSVQFARPDSLDAVNIPLSNLLAQIDDSGVTGYRPDVDASKVERLMRIDYTGADSASLGYLEVFERPVPGKDPEHFFRTEHTKMLVQGYDEIAKMLKDNLARIF